MTAPTPPADETSNAFRWYQALDGAWKAAHGGSSAAQETALYELMEIVEDSLRDAGHDLPPYDDFDD